MDQSRVYYCYYYYYHHLSSLSLSLSLSLYNPFLTPMYYTILYYTIHDIPGRILIDKYTTYDKQHTYMYA
jgi:hypothetical protein